MVDYFKKKAPSALPRPPVWRALAIQVILAMLLSFLVSLVTGLEYLGYWLTGVIIYTLSQILFTVRVFAYRGSDGHKIMRSAYSGVSSKIIIVGMAFALLFYRWPEWPALPTMGGFSFGALGQVLFAGLINRRGVSH